MADVLSKKKRSQVMAAVRSKGNKSTEVRLAAIFRAYGITGWRRNQMLPGRPDFVFRRCRLSVFVDGCFWHGCRWHLRIPQQNREYWIRKIARNVQRDRFTDRQLREAGWQVLRVWEHSLGKSESIVVRVRRALTRFPERAKIGPVGKDD